jgi:hypothetical protein
LKGKVRRAGTVGYAGRIEGDDDRTYILDAYTLFEGKRLQGISLVGFVKLI